ncbi:MAG: chemotaxis protein CheB [Pseudomonadota bacterium]
MTQSNENKFPTAEQSASDAPSGMSEKPMMPFLDVATADGSDDEVRPGMGDAFFVVGIGSSAGGLEAVRELVRSLPPDTPAAFVVVQHMSPQHKSLMATLVGNETKHSVIDLEDGTTPEANVIYVTPPNHDVVMHRGALYLQRPSPEAGAPKPSIDRFFISLAEELGERAVAIVLSGTGSDGSYGVQAIRSAGGTTIAQDDVTAKYDGMPISAIETGCVDLIMSPREIGTHLTKILLSSGNFEDLREAETIDHPMADVLQILLARTRVDFREYKPTTVKRRIERRMNALGIRNHIDYTNHCRSHPEEVDALFRDLLISVTRFFRDPDEFRSLEGILSTIVQSDENSPIRIWVAGCATGEEVYTLAILLAEALGGAEQANQRRVQIFASDIDENALKIAREGRYAATALDDVPAAYAEKYFSFQGEGVRVNNALREMVLFAKHNICQDPPFLNVDLICCRNLLIYFGAALRRKVLSRLHYALRPKGYLFLGNAEAIGTNDEAFVSAAPHASIYQKRLLFDGARARLRPPVDAMPTNRLRDRNTIGGKNAQEAALAREAAMFESLVRSISPQALLVSGDLRIHRVFGDLGGFVTLKESRRLTMSVNILRSPLDQEARTLVTLAIKHGELRRGIVHRLDPESARVVRLVAYPLSATPTDEKMAILAMLEWVEETTKTVTETIPIEETPAEVAKYIEKLETEIDNTREALQQTVEELETSNEELQSLNEELQSTNEELQATNEELETSNEELQSTNEELVTVNEELQVNTGDLTSLTEELAAILDNIGTAVVIVDTALQITRASKEAMDLLSLGMPVEGIHLSQVNLPEGFPPLAEISNQAMQLGKTLVHAIEAGDRHYVLRLAPYYGRNGRFRGASIVIVDATPAMRQESGG